MVNSAGLAIHPTNSLNPPSDQFAQSAVGGDPSSLGKAMDVLNSYADLTNKTYIKMSKVLQQKANKVVFMCMPEHKRKSWIEDILNPKED